MDEAAPGGLGRGGEAQPHCSLPDASWLMPQQRDDASLSQPNGLPSALCPAFYWGGLGGRQDPHAPHSMLAPISQIEREGPGGLVIC